MGEMKIVENLNQFEEENVNSNQEFSDDISKITEALSKAQGKLTSLSKGEQGHGYKYTSLAATIDVARPVLQEFGLVVVQLVGNTNNGNPQVTTILSHESGQYFKSVANMSLIKLPRGNDAQAAGAVYSYLRRYALQGILNLASEDNDASSNGEVKTTTTAASTTTEEAKPRRKFQKKKGF